MDSRAIGKTIETLEQERIEKRSKYNRLFLTAGKPYGHNITPEMQQLDTESDALDKRIQPLEEARTHAREAKRLYDQATRLHDAKPLS